MEGEKLFTIDGIEYKCVFMYGYNSHSYATVYNNKNGQYLGQIVDINKNDSNVGERLNDFLKTI